jgi:signal transduction histidine kinase
MALPAGINYAIIILMARGDNRVQLKRKGGEFLGSLRSSGKQMLVAREGLLKASREESEFLEQISHESRKLLNIVIGFTELMLDEVPGKINEEQRRSLNEILHSGKRLLKLVSNSVEKSEKEAVKKQ